MATIGNLITKENFSTSWTQSHSVEVHDNTNQNRYLFICAAVWQVYVWCNWWAFGQSGQIHLYASYYNGSTWSSESHWFIDGSDTSWGGSVSLRVGHNRTSGMDTTVNGDYPLWRIRYYPARSNTNWEMSASAGGWGLCDIPQYYDHARTQLIKSRGRSGTDALIHDSGKTDDSTNVLSRIFNPTRRRGSLIMATDDSELVYYPYQTGGL